MQYTNVRLTRLLRTAKRARMHPPVLVPLSSLRGSLQLSSFLVDSVPRRADDNKRHGAEGVRSLCAGARARSEGDCATKARCFNSKHGCGVGDCVTSILPFATGCHARPSTVYHSQCARPSRPLRPHMTTKTSSVLTRRRSDTTTRQRHHRRSVQKPNC